MHNTENRRIVRVIGIKAKRKERKMFFANVETLEELKKQYKKLVLKHHPDLGGNLRDMQDLNAEYDRLFNILKDKHNAAAAQSGNVKATTECPEEFRAIIEQIIFLEGLEIELCGSWVWVGGETYTHKDELKAAGFRWSRSKKMWYWHHAEEGARWSRGRKSMDEIRETYGSEKLQGVKRARIAA